MKLFPIRLMFAFACLLTASHADAKPNFPAVVKAAYALKEGKITQAACSLCHTQAPANNIYGKTLKDALKQAGTHELTAEIAHTTDNDDSDSDGFTNEAELLADTLPGEAKSKPTGTPNVQPLGVQTDITPPAGSAPQILENEPGLFDLKVLLTPDHAQHPILVHFPIALFMVSLLFDLIGYRKKMPILNQVGYYNQAAAAIAALPTLVTGILAWRIKYGGIPLQGVMLYHLVLAFMTTGLFWLLWAVRVKFEQKHQAKWLRIYFILAGLIFLIITLTGHLGGGLASGMTKL